MFSWKWPRKSWSEAKRPVFIDFGGENLVWILDGIGKSSGTCKDISKIKFLKKYGGDTTIVKTLISSDNV
jgi:hypothetical protein